MAREWIAGLRVARPDICIEVRWCPAHEEVEGNEKADEWVKQAAEEPDTQGVDEEWGSVWGTENAPSQIPSRPEEGDRGEEMGRSKELG